MDEQAQAQPPISNPPPPRRRRRFGWPLRITLGLIILAVVIVVVGEIIFVTSLPRDIVVRAVEKQFQLRITAKSLTTGWSGHTTLHDVTLSLPLADKALITVPEMQVGHTNLPWFGITGSLIIHSLVIDHPTIYITQDVSGRWNIQEVAQILGSSGGGSGSPGGSSSGGGNSSPQGSGVSRLPSIDLHDGSLIILDNKQRTSTIYPLSFSGQPEGLLVWHYDLQVPDHVKCAGRISPSGVWEHTAEFSISDLGPWVEPWIPDWPHDAAVSGQWRGRVVNNHLDGWLTLDDAKYASVTAKGSIQIGGAEGATVIRPRGLVINAPNHFAPQITANGGEIDLDGASIRSQRLAFNVAGGDASIDGKYLYADGSASVRARWENITAWESVNQSGNLSADYSVPFPGQSKVQAEINSQGIVSKAGAWNAKVDLIAQGRVGQPIDWVVNAPQLRWDGTNHLSSDLSGLTATVSTSETGAILREVHLGNQHPIAGAGGYDRAKNLWWIALDGRGWALPMGQHRALDVDLNAWGDSAGIHLDDFYAASNGLSLFGDGRYVYHQDKPVSAHLYLNQARPEGESPTVSWVRGAFQSHADLSGTVSPLDVSFSGEANGQNLFLKKRKIGDLKLNIHGDLQADPDVGPRIQLQSQNITLFGGQWHIDGAWPVKNKLLSVHVGVRDLPLTQAADSKLINGTLEGNWIVSLRNASLDGLEIEQENGMGPVVISNLSVGRWVDVDRIVVQQTDVHDGRAVVGPIMLSRDEGRATASIATTLANLTRVTVTYNVTAWPYTLPTDKNLSTVAWSWGKVDVDLKQRSAQGKANVLADVALKQKHLARVEVAADLDDRTIQASSIKINALGGDAAGEARVDLDHLTQTSASLQWHGMDTARFIEISPGAKNLAGHLDGSLSLYPATTARALEPTAFTIQLHPTKATIKGFSYGDARIYGFVGDSRLVLDDSPARSSSIDIAGGNISFWGRVSGHGNEQKQLLAQLDLHHVSLDQILRHTDENGKFTPGLIDGQVTLMGQPGKPVLATGSGQLLLSQSDLASWGPIALIYNTMDIGHDASKPVGNGTIDLRLESENLDILAVRYYDRGTEVRASGTIFNVFKGDDAQIDITAAGAAKPFSSIDIPGIADVQDALSVLQQDTVPVQITGTVGNYHYALIPFDSITKPFRELLLGDARVGNGQ